MDLQNGSGTIALKEWKRNSVSEVRFNALVLRDTPLLVLRDNSMPGTGLVGFAPVRWSVVLCSTQVAAEGRLGI
jgi:hypothetical protein